MSESFRPAEESLGNLIGPQSRRVIKVPKFQRGYSWDKSQIEPFWRDVKTFEAEEFSKSPIDSSYFLGPMVLLTRKKERVLLDGQQRLATATILISIFRDEAEGVGSTEGEKLADSIQTDYIENAFAANTFALELGELDKTFFRNSIQRRGVVRPKASIRSNKNIEAAAKYLRKEVGVLISALSDCQKIAKLKSLLDSMVTAMRVVSMEVQTEDDAFRIFETLNDRGLRLSAPDLVLNFLMSKAGNKAKRSQVREGWNDVLIKLKNKDAEKFLRHTWVSRHGDVKGRTLFAEIKDDITKRKVDVIEFVDECVVDSGNYIAIVEQNTDLHAEAASSIRGLIKYLNASSSIPLLLASMDSLNKKDFVTVSEKASSLAVRYLIISELNRDKFDNLMFSLARNIRSMKKANQPSAQIRKHIVTEFQALNPSDDAMKAAAKNVDLQRTPAIWILTQLVNEELSPNKEISADKANLEHIFPQNADSRNWPNASDLKQSIWKLGNLTLLGTKLNNDAQNKSFAVKKLNYYSSSKIRMTKSLKNLTAWNSTEVNTRSAKLAKEILKLFVV